MASKYIDDNEKSRIWYHNNKDKAKINNQKYRETHRELVRQREKTYKESLNGLFHSLIASSKKYAKKRENECTITYDDLMELWEKQEGRCAVTNVEMQLTMGTRKGKRNYWKVSIDRIDNSIGYTKENIHLVCFAVNQIKSDFTLEEFKFWIKTISSQTFNMKEGSTTISKESTLKRVEAPSSSDQTEDDDIVSSIRKRIAA